MLLFVHMYMQLYIYTYIHTYIHTSQVRDCVYTKVVVNVFCVQPETFRTVMLRIPFFLVMTVRDWVIRSRYFEATWCSHLEGSKCPRWYYVGSKCLNPITDSASYHNVTDSSAATSAKISEWESSELAGTGEALGRNGRVFSAI